MSQALRLKDPVLLYIISRPSHSYWSSKSQKTGVSWPPFGEVIRERGGSSMPGVDSQNHRLYIGSHDGVSALSSSDGGKTWEASKRTPLSHAASRLAASSSNPQRAYLAAYESGMYRTDDGGTTWQHLATYPSDYAHSVLVHPDDHQRVYVGSEPATIFSSRYGGETW